MGIVPASAFHSSELMRSLAADCAAHQLDLKAGLHQMMLCCYAAWGHITARQLRACNRLQFLQLTARCMQTERYLEVGSYKNVSKPSELPDL